LNFLSQCKKYLNTLVILITAFVWHRWALLATEIQIEKGRVPAPRSTWSNLASSVQKVMMAPRKSRRDISKMKQLYTGNSSCPSKKTRENSLCCFYILEAKDSGN